VDAVGLDGRRVGRVVAVACGPDPYTLSRVAIRLRGLQRGIRLVPASHASWHDTDALVLPYPAALIRHAPAPGTGDLRHPTGSSSSPQRPDRPR
jgi:hypothetical protein